MPLGEGMETPEDGVMILGKAGRSRVGEFGGRSEHAVQRFWELFHGPHEDKIGLLLLSVDAVVLGK